MKLDLVPGVLRAVLTVGPLALLHAQTFVVDAANGPGANFTQIAAAVAAVPDGATLLVRAGSYSQFVIDGKGLTILADPGVLVSLLVGVRNTAANQSVTLRGLAGTGCTAQLSNCAGAVTLSDCSINSTFDFFSGPSGGFLNASNCAQLVLERLTNVGSPLPNAANGSTLTACTATLDGCTLTGRAAVTFGSGLPNSLPATEALQLVGGTTVSSGCTLTAGGFGSPAGAPAVSMIGGDLRLVDGVLFGGLSVLLGPAIVGSGSLRIDPATTFSNFANPAFGPGLTPVFQPMPSLAANDAALGGTLTATLADPVGDAAIVILGLPGAPLLVPGIADAFWLDPAAYFFAAIGTAPLAATQPVPNMPVLRGFRLGWQGVAFDAANGLQASNAAVSLVR